jgi:hypothetical protein
MNDYIEIPGTGTLENVTDSSFTFAVWAKPASAPAGTDPDNNDTRASILTRPGQHTTLSYLPSEQFQFSMFSDDIADPQTRINSLATYPYISGLWHHLVGVVDASVNEVSFYVDGELQETKIYPGNLREYSTTSYYIGAARPDTYPSFRWPFKGSIDDARIYDHALTLDEVKALYYNSLQFTDTGLTQGTEYCYRVYPFKNDTCTNWSNHASVKSVTTVTNTLPRQPTNQDPADTATDVYELSPKLTADDFYDVDGDAHAASQWRVSTDKADFDGHVVYDSRTVAPAITHTITATLPTNIHHYWQVRYQDSKGEWSNYSDVFSFVISNTPPSKPVNPTPANGATGVGITPMLSASVFADSDSVNGDIHQASQWVISTDAAFSTIVYDSDSVAGTNSHTVANNLINGETYYWKVRYQDSRGEWSAYSTEASFTTLANVVPDQPS